MPFASPRHASPFRKNVLYDFQNVHLKIFMHIYKLRFILLKGTIIMKKAHSASAAVGAEGRGDAGYQVAMHLPRRTGLPKLTQQISKWHISSIEKY